MAIQEQETNRHPVVIIGAGRGGSALLEMFMEDSMVRVVAMADINPDASGIRMAKEYGIPTYSNAASALEACKGYPDCIVFNLSHDNTVAEHANRIFGDKRVASGLEVKMFWEMVTNLKQVKEELEKSQRQLQAIIHNAMDGIIMIDERGDIQGFNPAAEQIFGYTQQSMLGKNVKLLMPEPTQSEHEGYIARYLKTGHHRMIGKRGREVTAIRKNSEQFPMEVSVSEMVLGGSRYFVGIVRDITERKLTEQKIAHLAHHDYLTGLPNRVLFLNNLEHSLGLARRNNYKVSILFLDLDGFKKINDTLGHEAGDMLLQEVAKRLKEIIRNSDTVARVGGDEFTFILDNIGSEENAALTAQKIIAALGKPFDLNGHQRHIGGSIGIAIFPDDADQIGQLIKQADDAMYLAKQSGKNTYKFHREILQKHAAK